MDKKLLEEIKRIKFISDYDNSTTISEQRTGVQKFNKFIDDYSPFDIKTGQDGFDIKASKTKNIIDKSWGQPGGSDELDYEDDKFYSGGEESKFEADESWKIGYSYLPDAKLILTLGHSKEQNAIAGMRKAMDPTSIQNWQKIIDNPKNVRFVYETINLYARKYIDTDLLTPKKGLKIIVGDNSFVDLIEKSISTPATSEDYQVPMSLPVNSSPNAKFFKNNSSDLEPLFISEVDGMITAIKAQMAKMKDPQVYLSYLSVLTSASRLRNTFDAKDKTWLVLSKERSDSAKTYVLKRLDEIGVLRDKTDGVMITTEYKIDYNGQNGDGSSGPNPDKPYQFNTDGLGTWYCGDTTEKGKNCKGKRSSMGIPQSIENLEKNKYLVVNLAVIFKAQKEQPKEVTPTEEPETDEVTKSSYNVKFILPPKGGRFKLWLPQITIEFGRKKRHVKKGFFNNPKNWGKQDCWFEDK
jgi:hypothetical protein